MAVRSAAIVAAVFVVTLGTAVALSCYAGLSEEVAVAKTTATVALSFYLMGHVVDGYLVPALVQIGRRLKMTDALLASTLLAFGGGASDFMTGFVSAVLDTLKDIEAGTPEHDRSGDVSLWLGSVFGTGVFVNTLVASMIMFYAGPEGVSVKATVFTRDVLFRMYTVALMLLFGHLGYVSTELALLMVLSYVAYVVLNLRESASQARGAIAPGPAQAGDGVLLDATGPPCSSHSSFIVAASALSGSHIRIGPDDGAEQEDYPAGSCGDRMKHHAGWEDSTGSNCLELLGFVIALPFRPLFALTMATTRWDPLVSVIMPVSMCMFVPFANPFGNMYKASEFGSPNFIFIAALMLLGCGCAVRCAVLAKGSPGTYIAPQAYYWATFVTALLWMALLADEAIDGLRGLGAVFGLSPTIMGVTMLAWGNSIENLFATISLARAGEFRVAVTGVFASPMFDCLFGTGAILIMLTVIKGGSIPIQLSGCPNALLCANLGVLVLTLVHTKVNGWRMTRTLGWILAVSYPVILVLGIAIDAALG